LRGLSQKSSIAFLLTQLLNICRFQQASLSASWLLIAFPRDNLSTFIALYVAFTFFVSATPSFHMVSKNFLETELEALNDKEVFPLFTAYH
jgi:hypothetical protein